MSIDSRLLDLDQADHDEPTDTFRAQLAVVVDNLMAGYLRNAARTDTMLRRDGLTYTADRLVELFGPAWWERCVASRGEQAENRGELTEQV